MFAIEHDYAALRPQVAIAANRVGRLLPGWSRLVPC